MAEGRDEQECVEYDHALRPEYHINKPCALGRGWEYLEFLRGRFVLVPQFLTSYYAISQVCSS